MQHLAQAWTPLSVGPLRQNHHRLAFIDTGQGAFNHYERFWRAVAENQQVITIMRE